ncbi:MAG: hypothetical protein V1854_02035 [Methanobacteriota archaeon]
MPEFKDGKHTGAYTINRDIVAMGLSLRSLYLVSQYIPFLIKKRRLLPTMLG